MIRLDNVTKIYRKDGREVPALCGFDLHVDRGGFVAVRGPSGSGKTTLLLTAGGMIRPTSGKVLLDGEDLYALSPKARAQVRARRVGFVFQMFHLVPYLNVLENVLAAGLASGGTDPARARELVEQVGLAHRLRHRPGELSAGERQRVAIARALLNRPDVILADEPTGNLDPDNAAAVMEHLAAFHRAGGTVLLVTHESLAERYAERTVLLSAPEAS